MNPCPIKPNDKPPRVNHKYLVFTTLKYQSYFTDLEATTDFSPLKKGPQKHNAQEILDSFSGIRHMNASSQYLHCIIWTS